MLQKMRRQFFSFFMPRLHRQLYSGLCFMASMALRHSPCASVPVTALKLLSLPATHCLMVRYLVLQVYSFKHCSLAFTQSSRLAARDGVPSPFRVDIISGWGVESKHSTSMWFIVNKAYVSEVILFHCNDLEYNVWFQAL